VAPTVNQFHRTDLDGLHYGGDAQGMMGSADEMKVIGKQDPGGEQKAMR
jgi:hypothetical protein